MTGKSKKKYPLYQDKKLYYFLLGLAVTAGDFDLVCSSFVFIATLLLSARMKWFLLLKNIYRTREFLQSENGSLVASVIVAGLLSLITYSALNIWSETDNKWLALGVILQLLLAGGGIFVSFNRWLEKEKESELGEILYDLTGESNLRRLWAMNQILLMVDRGRLNEKQIEEIREYLLLLKEAENEPIIIKKIEHCLRIINPPLPPLRVTVKNDSSPYLAIRTTQVRSCTK
ncbi:MAG: hypothetical protein NZ901_09340 [Geminocystis sp.]|nr:hypothetical protein [Geminocystis sp.]HIK38898.1 hypothetical protein [Geminocystis sp. M7585_C2015_104]MCS7148378.1 hypothetical protein [Geminocystis sp.]MCX8078308.1 hypothetical protein [Geminocystis sp.]MDW8116034.1 hypothetical protein [Geminocystis sp.]